MTQMRLNLNLPPKLMLHSTLQQLTLTQYLERNNILCSTLTSEVDLAKFAPPERFADFKVIECPSCSGLGGVFFVVFGEEGGFEFCVVVVIVVIVDRDGLR